MEEGKIEIDGDLYDKHIVDAFLKTSGLEPDTFNPENPEWFLQLMASHLTTFKWGYDYGYQVASSEAPDCDECDVHAKAAERGPPENHHSQQDR